MDPQVLVESVTNVLLRAKSTSSERAGELFRNLPGRNGFVPRLKRWFEENISVFPEPFNVEDLDSIHDQGVDVLLTGLRSDVRIGFQVKSDNDLRSPSFTRELKAQIQDAQGIGVELVVIIFACEPTKKNIEKIRYWQNYVLSHPHILCLPPERAAGLYEAFDFPLEPIALPECTWADFFRSIGKPNLASFYLDPWPEVTPDQRFLRPNVFYSVRESLEESHLTFLVGPPASGKTFMALQLLWKAFQDHRPVHWITAADAEITEGPIARAEADTVERMDLRRRVDVVLRALGSPHDAVDVVSRVLAPGALVYIEDPFGKREGEYDVSLASYSFFDLQRFVEELERSSARAGCRILVTSREALFQRWTQDLRVQGLKVPRQRVVRLTHDDYYPGPLFQHARLLAEARGLAGPEAIADILVDRVESPFEIETLIRSMPPNAGVLEAQEIVAGWEGDLIAKVEDRIAPRDDRDALLLLLVAASAFRYDSLRSPGELYRKLHTALRLEGESQVVFDAILKQLSPFLNLQRRASAESRPFMPSHSIIQDAIQEQLSSVRQRPLLRRVARALPDIPPRPRPPRSPGRHLTLADLFDPWGDHFLVALYLLSLGLAQDGAEEGEALERILFDLAGTRGSKWRGVIEFWRLLPDRFRNKIVEALRRAPQDDAWGLREAAAYLPHIQVAPGDAWAILELLLQEPQRGSVKTIYQESPWAYLFLHLDEVPQSLREKLDTWARENPASFVHAMDEELLKNWERLPFLWRSCLFHPSCLRPSYCRNELVWTTARLWDRAPQPYREIFDFLARSPVSTDRSLVGSQALFRGEQYPDLEIYALEASRDPDPMVRLEAFRWGRGDDLHHRLAEVLLDGATPGFAAEVMLILLEEEVTEDVTPWEKEVLPRCERLGGDAAKAAIAYAGFKGKKRVRELGYNLPESPFEEPEIVRAAWLWSHLESRRSTPVLSDDDLKSLLRDFEDSRIRAWCLAQTSSYQESLPEEIQQFLTDLANSSELDAAAVHEGAELGRSNRLLPFDIYQMVSDDV